MTHIPASKAREDFADTLNRVAYGGERIVLHRRGKAIAALVPIEDLTFLEKLEDRLELDEARAALEETQREGTVPWEQLK
jgi:prevent-host-death family protein